MLIFHLPSMTQLSFISRLDIFKNSRIFFLLGNSKISPVCILVIFTRWPFLVDALKYRGSLKSSVSNANNQVSLYKIIFFTPFSYKRSAYRIKISSTFEYRCKMYNVIRFNIFSFYSFWHTIIATHIGLWYFIFD